ncbi:DUF6658 family protein [Nostoc sp. TCL26-01]|uniref:DUF6658 family protein n=1 Tax=Nostoc sp. TCL26-01 TaxID=2576904 RepID=UPI0015BCEED9|nr:DUF6658 family protein [Nostoc sp. TCL26-01]QLE56678.1 hypothetical protein FD725_14900 [Nostoc sp. TCL26-01]
MNSLMNVWKKLQLRQIVTVFLAGILLIANTNQASLLDNSKLLITTNTESELLYPGAETPAGRIEKERELPIITQEDFQRPEPGNLIQNEPNVGTRIQERLETVKESVQEASKFLQNSADEATSRPELQPNQAVRK